MAPHAKRRKVESAVAEISFDPAARHEYLTGFHKRKLQRTKQAQEYAEMKAREERRQARKKIREERAAELERVLDESRRRMEEIGQRDSESDSNTGGDDEWAGFEEPPPLDYEAEYIDEDKYTTVTVEELDASKDALYKANAAHTDANSNPGDEDPSRTESAPKRGPKSDKPKKKRKNFRYESKAERKITQRKERLGSRKKATARRER